MDLKRKSYWVKYLPFFIIPLLAKTWGISKYPSTNKMHVNHLQIKTNLSPMGQGVLPEQRRTFALKFQENTNFKGAIFITSGEFHTTFSIQSNKINNQMVSSMSSIDEPYSDLRKVGFKHLLMSNGKEIWDIDLKNE
jgi:hypothetical protein